MNPIAKAIASTSIDKPHVHRINLQSATLKPVSSDLLQVIGKIIKVYNVKKQEDARYNEAPLSADFKLPHFSIVKVYYAKPKSPANSLMNLLKKVGCAIDFSTHTLHFLFFLGNEQKELFALTTNHSWNVIKSVCDCKFPFAIAKKLTMPIFAYSEAKPIVGNEISEAKAYKDEYQAQEHQLQNIWKIFRNFSTSFKEDSSLFMLKAFEDYQNQKIGVSFGVGQINLGINMTLPALCETVDHFSKIYLGVKTYKQNGDEEVDDPNFRFLDYVQSVNDNRHKKLNEELLNQIWLFFSKKITLADFYFCHKYSVDFCCSTEFKMSYQGSPGWEKTWHYPPTFFEVIAFLQDNYQAVNDKERFLKYLSHTVLKYNRKESAYTLKDFFQGELRDKEHAYFRVEGIWHEVKADYLIIVQRHFCHLLQSHLISKKQPGYIEKLWFRNEDWTSFSQEEAIKETGLNSFQVTNGLRALADKKYAILDEEGYVLYPHAVPTLFSNSDRGIEKKRADLDHLLKKQRKITEADLKKIGFKEAKALLKSLQKLRPVLKSVTIKKTDHWIVQGPVPDDNPLKDFLNRKRQDFLNVGKEEFFNRAFLGEEGYLVGDQVYATEKEKVELWDILYHGEEESLYLYQVKSGFGQSTRDACSQIRVAAQALRADLSSNNPLLRQMYAKATEEEEGSQFKKQVADSYKQFSEEEFIDLFRSKPRYEAGKGIVFVYAVLDDNETERSLSEERDIETPFKRSDFSAWTDELVQSLKTAGYLTDDLRITSKLLKCSQKDFCCDPNISLLESEKKKLYKILSDRDTNFNSVIAKLELINLKCEMEKWGFGFKILQIKSGRTAGEHIAPVRLTEEPVTKEKQTTLPFAPQPSQPMEQAAKKRKESETASDDISKFFFKMQRQTSIRPGIKNNGNDCFLISALQLLLQSNLLPLISDEKQLAQTAQSKAWFSEFDPFQRLHRTSTTPLTVSHFRGMLGFPQGTQEDAGEAVQRILAFYNPASFSSKIRYEREIDLENAYYFDGDSEKYSQIDENNCLVDPQDPVALVLDMHGDTFQEVLNHLFSRKEATGTCTFTDTEGDLFRTESYVESCIPISMNDTLIVTLKRFDARGRKLDDEIDFSEGRFQIGQKWYKLDGFIQHIGKSKSSGHYITYSKQGAAWHCYNDESVTPKAEFAVMNAAKHAYVLRLAALV